MVANAILYCYNVHINPMRILKMNIKDLVITMPNKCAYGTTSKDNEVFSVIHMTSHCLLYTKVEFKAIYKTVYLKGHIDISLTELFSLLTGIQIMAIIGKSNEIAFEKGKKEKQNEILSVLGLL